MRFKSNATVRITATRTAGDTRITSELVLQPTNVGALWRELNWMLRAPHLFDAHLRLTHGNLAWVVRQLIDVEQRALHLLRGIALQHVHRHAAALGINNRRTALLELVANRHYSISLIGGSRRRRGESEFTNRRLKLLARNAMREHSQFRELTSFMPVVVISARCLIPLRWNKCAVHGAANRLVVHLCDC